VTPPALARMSGTTTTSRFVQDFVGFGPRGFFAASMTISLESRGDIFVMDRPPSAAGMSRSTSARSSSSFVIASEPGNPAALCDRPFPAK